LEIMERSRAEKNSFLLDEKQRSRDWAKARSGPENNGFAQDEKRSSNNKVGGGKKTKERKKDRGCIFLIQSYVGVGESQSI
jgi:hypothetical protein